jgi:F420-dependent methylenetetrahydromethanopterin dehydrogenase
MTTKTKTLTAREIAPWVADAFIERCGDVSDDERRHILAASQRAVLTVAKRLGKRPVTVRELCQALVIALVHEPFEAATKTS